MRSGDTVLSSSNENVALLFQYYLVMKMDCSCSVSVLFGDEDAARQILSSQDPKFQKKMGRKVQNFDEDTWNKECINIVKKANMAKVIQ